MATAFADIEAFVNAGAQALLGNATLSYVSGLATLAVDGILYDRRNEDGVIGVPRRAREISFELLESQLGGIVKGTPVAVRGVNYTVANVERDKSGRVVLTLGAA